ncbi:synaptobrevin domain-containing protein [Tieghemostelium lacteum]|uniref:Synaptobrevin domain-containing protein n=1 Tax=Tieghemostelium lacteum TaxID=361077 RepID=A0A151ZHZ3_TIELA|nr:synaptobrevin domain-containing protein [Tieghemostelium lacteum]|eukprot:KYQ93618.1 synaptobrevin domain-containing protein [Tieghemostelium lacteum]
MKSSIKLLLVFLALVVLIVKCQQVSSSSGSWGSSDDSSSQPPTPYPTWTSKPTSNPAPTSTPSPNSAPNTLWGIFSLNLFHSYNITKYSFSTNTTEYYPIPKDVRTPYTILQVNDTSVIMVVGDYFSMNIVFMDLETSRYDYLQTMQYNTEIITFYSVSFGYDETSNTLYNIGYVSNNVSILIWNFETQEFSSISINGEAFGSVNGLYNANTNIFFANLYNNTNFQPVIYTIATFRSGTQAAYPITNLQPGAFNFLSQTSDNSLYGISDNDGYIMVYKLDLNNGQGTLYYHNNNFLFNNAPFTFNQFIIFCKTEPNYLDNSITLLNTHNGVTKTITIGSLPNYGYGNFFIASE